MGHLKSILVLCSSVLLLALLTWLALSGASAEALSAQKVLRQMDIFAAAEAALHRDLLRSRAGLVSDNDLFVHEIDALRSAVIGLRAAMPGDPEYAAGVDRLADMVEQQTRSAQEFKTENALLQSALTELSLISLRLRKGVGHDELVRLVSPIESALLRLTRDSSQATLTELDHALEELEGHHLAAPEVPLARILVLRAKQLRTAVPATDRVLKLVFTIPSKLQQDRVRALMAQRAMDSEHWASIFRYVLYAISLILVCLTAILALCMQSRARTLHRSAQIQSVIANLSTRFIRIESCNVESGIEQALGELAECISADRAYYVTVDQSRRYRWNRRGAQWPPEWPDYAFALEAVFGNDNEGLVCLPKIDLCHSKHAVVLPSDICGVLALSLVDGAVSCGVVAFESTHGSLQLRCSESGLFRMACDALTNAIERDALMKERQCLEATLQRARRLDTIGAFASGIAHNFNNIVGTILGYTEMAQGQLEANKAPTTHLIEIKRAGERARDLVDQILKFGRPAVSAQETISLSKLLEETSSLLRASLPPSIDLNVRQYDGELLVGGQWDQLQQVILNVVNNAAQAIDGTGSIFVSLRRRSIDASIQLDHGSISPGDYAMISVTDTGRGMDEATREQIFEPFFTTRADGNGLGLATVHETVLNNGGAIAVDSTPGAGTRFDIWLPCLNRSALASKLSEKNEQPVGGSTILLCGHDRERLLRHEEIIAALGFEPVGFLQAKDAIEAVQNEPDRFDAALLCHLHGTTATFDLARALSHIAPLMPILLATTAAGDLGAPMLASVGICAVVGLPVRSGELSNALARCIATAPRKRRLSSTQALRFMHP